MSTTMTPPPVTTAAMASFATAFHSSETAGPPALVERRRAAMAGFLDAGLPTTHDEEYRFTSLAPLARTAFVHGTYGMPYASSRDHSPLINGDVFRFDFVNGSLVSADGAALPAGVVAKSLRSALADDPDAAMAHLGTVASDAGYPFIALNTAFFHDGLYLLIPAGVVVETPILLRHCVRSGDDGNAMAFPRVLVVAGENSQVRIIEVFTGVEGETALVAAVAEFVVGDAAVVDHYRLVDEALTAFHFGAIDARQGRAASFSTQAFNFGGALVRNDVGVHLAGEGGTATMNGLTRIGGRQVVDNHTRIDHAVPRCETHEFYKSVLDGQSRYVFNGKILVREDAQKTNSKQTNRNLLLSKDALANSNPQLEIYADDVKCTHGATVGQIEDDYVYYLRTRGIPEAEARNLLVYAFANDVIARVNHAPLRGLLDARVLDLTSVAR